MEDWGEPEKAMRVDIDQLKDQINQILKALTTLKSSRETITVKNEEAVSSYPPVIDPGRLHTQNNKT